MDIQNLEFDGSQIKKLLPKDKTLSQLAKEVGVSRQAMHDIAKRRRKPSADLMVKITTALNVSLSQLSSNNSQTVS
jgi:DNA-binding XRE family transcriptional regulator